MRKLASPLDRIALTSVSSGVLVSPEPYVLLINVEDVNPVIIIHEFQFYPAVSIAFEQQDGPANPRRYGALLLLWKPVCKSGGQG